MKSQDRCRVQLHHRHGRRPNVLTLSQRRLLLSLQLALSPIILLGDNINFIRAMVGDLGSACWATSHDTGPLDYSRTKLLSFLTRKLLCTRRQRGLLHGLGFTSSSPLCTPNPCMYLYRSWTPFGPHTNACCESSLWPLGYSPLSYLGRSVLCNEVKGQFLRVGELKVSLGSNSEALFLRVVVGMPGRVSLGES